MKKTTQKTGDTQSAVYKKRLAAVIIPVMLTASVLMVITGVYMYNTYRDMYVKQLFSSAQDLCKYAADRVLAYNAYPWLIEHWPDDFSDVTDEDYDKIQTMNPTMITGSQLDSLPANEQKAFSYVCYDRIASGFDMMYDNFICTELHLVKFDEDGNAICLIDGKGDDPDHVYFPDSTGDFDYIDVADHTDGSVNSSTGAMQVLTTVDGVDYAVNYLPVRDGDKVLCYVVWSKGWKDIQDDVQTASIKLSAVTLVLYLAVEFVLILLIQRYEQGRRNSAAALEKQQMEMDIASRIQLSQMPNHFDEFEGRKDFSVFGHIRPANEVGGDFYDCFLLDNDHFALYIADVSDKGVAAALFMMYAKSVLRDSLIFAKSPAKALAAANDRLARHNDENLFVTAWLCVVQLSTGSYTAANAGHENPVVIHSDGQIEFLRYAHNLALAITFGCEYTEHTGVLNEGDTLFVYTDGVTDAINSSNVRFTEKGLQKALESIAPADVQRLTEGVLSAVDSYAGDTPQYDDITMLSFRYNGSADMTMAASDEDLPMMTAFLLSKAENAGADEKTLSNIRLCSEEIFGNIVDYAYTEGGDVTVSTAAEKDTFTVTFIDSGIPFDPTLQSTGGIEKPFESRDTGGLGIYLTEQLADKSEYNRTNDKNVLTLSFKLITVPENEDSPSQNR